MKTKVLANLKTMSQAAAEIVATGYTDREDEFQLRFMLHQLLGIINRVDKKPREIPAVKKEVWDCHGL